jgi:Tol biopolymer transport system component
MAAAMAMAVALAGAQAADSRTLQQAIDLIESKGDVRAALPLLEAAAKSSDRAVAARALLYIGQVRAASDPAGARNALERILAEFPDQKAVAEQARVRLGNRAAAAGDQVLLSGDAVPEPAWTSVSPTGEFLAYTDLDTGVLAIRSFGTGAVRRIEKSVNEGDWVGELAVSRDGRLVAYAVSMPKRQSELRVMSIDDASASFRVLARNSDAYVIPQEWSTDGTQIAVQISRADSTTQIGLISTKDGSIRGLKTLGWRGSSTVALSPDGKWLAYDAPGHESTAERDVFVLAADGSREVAVARGPSRETVAGWAPDGRSLLYLSDQKGPMALWSQPLVNGQPAGAPRMVAPNFRGTPLRITASGELVYYVVAQDQSLQVAAVDFQSGKRLTGPTFPALDRWGANRQPRWSRDGASLAYVSSRPRASTDRTMAIQSLDTGAVREVPLQLAYIYTYDWSPDGTSFIARATDLKGRQGVFRIDAQSGAVQPVALNGDVGHFHPEWSRDGMTIYYVKGKEEAAKGVSSDAGQSYIEREMQSDEERVLFRQHDVKTGDGTTLLQLRKEGISPDGRYVAAFSVRPQSTLYVIEIATRRARALLHRQRPGVIGRNGGVQWTADSRGLVVNLGADSGVAREMWFVPLQGDAKRLDIGVDDLVASAIAVHPDGQRIAFVAGQPTAIEIRQLATSRPAAR